jgi:hypothetical protein
MMVPTGTIGTPTKAPTNKLGVPKEGPAAKSTKTHKATKAPGATKDAKSAKTNVAKGKLRANADVKEDPLFTR